jgi:hypothetical protein
MTVLILLTTAGAGTGPFNLYSNVDGYVTPFETGVAKASLTTPPGYTSALVPNGTTTVRVQSTGACTNYIDLVIGATTTTTTTSGSLTTTTTSGSLTTTTTLSPAECGDFSLEGGISGRTFNFTNCDGVPQTVVVPAGDAVGYCIRLPYSAAGATYIAPCGDSTLTFSYIGGNNLDTEGTFVFNLSSPLPANITITGAGVTLYGTGCGIVEDTASQASPATINSGSTLTSVASSSVACTSEFARGGFLSVNGNPLSDGGTINIGGVTLTVSINTSCVFLPCLA